MPRSNGMEKNTNADVLEKPEDACNAVDDVELLDN